MSAQSNSTPASSFDPQRNTPVIIAATHPLYWSIRRELWENRSIYIAPLAVAGVTLVGFLIATIGRALASSPAQRLAILEEPYNFATGTIMASAVVVGVLYCLDALYGERRDRSILFWKSLPVSDFTTVLAKASIPFVVLPLLAFAITIVTQLMMMLLSMPVLHTIGVSVTTLWNKMSFFQTSLLLLYHLVTVHILWYAPIYCWMLLISSWARRATFLWAVLPPLAIGILEKIAFNTSHFAALMQYRFEGGPEAVVMPGTLPMDPMTHLTPLRFLSSPGLWLGLLVAAIFLAVAVRLRRYQGPI